MNQQARKIWNSPQGVNLFQQMLSGKPLQACIDPAVSAQVRPLMQMPQREFSCSAPDADADGCKSQSSPR